jgi:hypothetical protein
MLAAAAPTAEHYERVPVEFRNDQLFAIANIGRERVTFFLDSGGGWNAIRQSTADSLRLPKTGKAQGDSGELDLVDFAPFAAAGLPSPASERWLRGRLAVVPDAQLSNDGFLGSRWFAGRIWEIDYPSRSLKVLQGWRPDKNDACVVLGFRSGADGKRNLNFPRVVVTVDGEPLDMLLDTGATAQLSRTSAHEFSATTGTKIGTSYISKAVFDRWVAHHPEWKVISNAETVTGRSEPMIRVADITIAGEKIGPVWFTRRPDANFLNYMSRMTDKPVVGAVGGSTLKYFRVILDYPNRSACFWSTTSQLR